MSAAANESTDKKRWSVPQWFRWLLAKWWGLILFIIASLLGSILLIPLAQGLRQWPSGVKSLVASALLWAQNRPVPTGIAAGLILLLTLVGYLADHKLKQQEKEEERRSLLGEFE
ncbi:MAG TPA: hypothetical protein VH593_09375, partial [Ktedonobacteraceae bacterium]